MFFDYNEQEQIKDNNGKVKYFKQIHPFTNLNEPFTKNKMFKGIISIKEYGNCLLFFSKESKQFLGMSNICTLKLFEEV